MRCRAQAQVPFDADLSGAIIPDTGAICRLSLHL
jgi:hypothetical protein